MFCDTEDEDFCSMGGTLLFRDYSSPPPSSPQPVTQESLRSSEGNISSSSSTTAYGDAMDIVDDGGGDDAGERLQRALDNPDGPIDIVRLFPDEAKKALAEDAFFLFGREMSSVFWPNITLLPHQMSAVRWMLLREWIPFYGMRGGLLSFVMGMGKTLAMLVVIASDRIFKRTYISGLPSSHTVKYREFVTLSGNDPRAAAGSGHSSHSSARSKTTLVLVTEESLSAWLGEISKFFVPNTFSVAALLSKKRSDDYSNRGVVTYYNASSSTGMSPLFDGKTYDIVFVTYSIMTAIHTKWFGKGERSVPTGIKEDSSAAAADGDTTTSPSTAERERKEQKEMVELDPRVNLFFTHWRRLVSDEIHTLSDPSTCKSVAARRIDADRVWGITGTPLQNGIDDYLAICCALRVRHPVLKEFAAKKYKLASLTSQRSGLVTESEVVAFCSNLDSIITIKRAMDTAATIHIPQELAPTLHRLVSLGIPLTQLRLTAATLWTTMPWEVARFSTHNERYCFVDKMNGRSRPLSESLKYFCLMMGADEMTARKLSEYGTPLDAYNTDPHQRKSLLSDGQVPVITAERIALRLIIYHSPISSENAEGLIPGEPHHIPPYTTDDAMELLTKEMQDIVARKPPVDGSNSQLKRIRDYMGMCRKLGSIATRIAQGMHASDIAKSQAKIEKSRAEALERDLEDAFEDLDDDDDIVDSQQDGGADPSPSSVSKKRKRHESELSSSPQPPSSKKSKSNAPTTLPPPDPHYKLKAPITVVYFRPMQPDSIEAHLLEAAQTSLRKSKEKKDRAKNMRLHPSELSASEKEDRDAAKAQYFTAQEVARMATLHPDILRVGGANYMSIFSDYDDIRGKAIVLDYFKQYPVPKDGETSPDSRRSSLVTSTGSLTSSSSSITNKKTKNKKYAPLETPSSSPPSPPRPPARTPSKSPHAVRAAFEKKLKNMTTKDRADKPKVLSAEAKEKLEAKQATLQQKLNMRAFLRGSWKRLVSQKMRMVKSYMEQVEPDDKVVIFCRYTRALYAYQGYLEDGLGYTSAVYCGDQTVGERNAIRESFGKTTAKQFKVLLMSITTAASLNGLQIANHVIVLDNGFNPATESQAKHRIIRLGQTKEMHIGQFVIAGSFEDLMFNYAGEKTGLHQRVTGSDWALLKFIPDNGGFDTPLTVTKGSSLTSSRNDTTGTTTTTTTTTAASTISSADAEPDTAVESKVREADSRHIPEDSDLRRYAMAERMSSMSRQRAVGMESSKNTEAAAKLFEKQQGDAFLDDAIENMDDDLASLMNGVVASIAATTTTASTQAQSVKSTVKDVPWKPTVPDNLVDKEDLYGWSSWDTLIACAKSEAPSRHLDPPWTVMAALTKAEIFTQPDGEIKRTLNIKQSLPTTKPGLTTTTTTTTTTADGSSSGKPIPFQKPAPGKHVFHSNSYDNANKKNKKAKKPAAAAAMISSKPINSFYMPEDEVDQYLELFSAHM